MINAATIFELRAYGNLPAAVADGIVVAHLDAATRDLVADSGLAAAPVDQLGEWDEARFCRALALMLPKLHTFTLQGSAQAMRTAERADAYFMSPDEQASTVSRYNKRYTYLVARLQPIGINRASVLGGMLSTI